MPGLKRTYSVSADGPAKKQKHTPRRKSVSRVTKSAIKRVLRETAEQKYDQSITPATEVSISNGGAPYFFDFPIISPGDDSNQRDGNKVHIRDIECKFTLFNPGTAQGDKTFVRVMLLEIPGRYMTNSNVEAALFEPTTGSSDLTYYGDIRDIISKTNRENFRLLRDEVIPLNNVQQGNDGNSYTYRHWYVPVNKDVYYQDDGGLAVSTRYALVFMNRDCANDGAVYSVELNIAAGTYFTDI